MTGLKSLRERSSSIAEERERRRAAGIENTNKIPPTSPAEAKTAPGRTALHAMKTVEAEERAEAAEKALAEALKNAGPQKAKLADLHEVPGRRRILTAEQYAELKANLSSNPLSHPVTVRRRPKGGYEIISGHNRVAIYRELGREEIDIHVLDLDDIAARRTAFHTNLLQPDLPDFEKFHGFKELMTLLKMNQKQVAEDAGVSEATVSQCMKFEALPAEALALVATAPACMGSKTAEALAKLAKKGRAAEVVAAVKELVAGKIAQAAAVKMAAGEGQKTARSEARSIARGQEKKYCSVVRARNSIRLDFKSEEEAAAVEEAVFEFLKTYAKQGAGT